MSLKDIKKIREEKIASLQKDGINPYPSTSERTHEICEALERFDGFAKEKSELVLAGRMMLRRVHGGSAFFHFMDDSGRMQGYAKKDALGESAYKAFIDFYDVGDVVEVSGKLFLTKKGEKTLEATRIALLAKSLRPLPEKWHGLTDTEERFRKRYLDLIMNPEARERFTVRSALIRSLRDFFVSAGFLEVETPILQTIPGGALAKPFKNRLETLNLDLYLRVAPELYLKRLLVGGFERVFEIGRCFRNEGMDKDHNPEFTMLEAYAAYKDYEWLMVLTEQVFQHLARDVFRKDRPVLTFCGNEVSFVTPWPRHDLNDLVKEHTGLDFWDNSQGEYLAKCKELGIIVEKTPSKTALFDKLFKNVARPKIQNPTFVINHPLELSPLAKTHRSAPRKVERFQLIVGGMEVVNAFSELKIGRA